MEAYAQALNYGIPFFMLLMLIEFVASRVMGKGEVINSMDTISSLSSGFTNIIKDVLQLVIPILVYAWLVDKIALTHIENIWIAIPITVIFKDFIGYWVHRLEHTVNYFWNRHVIHHSSEEFNLACALRQSISEFTTITSILLIPLALIGISVEVFAIVSAVHLFAQFWYHTRLINKMGFLEKFMVTPSHHRVHHAMNDIYMDRNYGQIFIIWDKMFGSFQEEQDDIPPVYGIKRAARTWNPFLINFQHLWLIVKDCWRTKHWKDKFLVWFKPTGWRPADMEEKYPEPYVEDVSKLEKYRPNDSVSLNVWSWTQLFFNFALMMYLFNFIATIGFPHIYVYGAFLFLSVFSFTNAMDQSKHAWWVELLKSVVGMALLFVYGGWFGAESISPVINYLIGGYFVVSALIVIAFHFTTFRKASYNQLSQA